MKALTIIQTKTGFLVTETPNIPPVNLAEAQCFEELGNRFTYHGVIDAVIEYFEPRTAPELREVSNAA